MNFNEIETTIKQIEDKLGYFGLGDFAVHIMKMQDGNSHKCIIEHEITLPYIIEKPEQILEAFRSVIENIGTSKHATRLKKENEQEVGALKERIKELEKYETYYVLAKGL